MTLMDFIAVVAIYVEIAVLAIIDMKLWRTIYTPLNLLMLPYALMLMVALLSCGNWGIVDFYYPSLQVWMIGLPIFALPGFIFGIAFRNKLQLEGGGRIEDGGINMRRLNIITTIIVAAFILRFIMMVRTSPYLPGSEDFGYDYCGGGLWGHLHRLLHALSIIYIYKYDKKHWYYLLLIGGMYFVTLMYGVKSWVLIPAMGGICMRLFAGKIKLKMSLFLKVAAFAFVVFFVTYTFSLFLGQEETATFDVIFEIICKNFVHYVISGIVGWSQDLQMGILESPRFEVLLTNILNLYNVVAGNEYVDPVNPFFIHNGVRGSNVRAFFGTIYINASMIQFVLVVLAVSAVHYLVKLWAVASRSIYVNVLYFFYGGMLLMGWFEIYFYHLQFFEQPFMIFVIYMMMKIGFKKKNTEVSTAENNEQDGGANTRP